MRLRAVPTLILAGLLASFATSAGAQLPTIPGTSTPTPKPQTTATPRPSATPRATDDPLPIPTPAPEATVEPIPTVEPVSTLEPLASPGRYEIPLGYAIPIFARTPARNTKRLVEELSRASSVGMTLPEALVKGMGRFPVAGLAFWSDDWMNARFTPVFHLHQGLDIFADFGTPVRAVDAGVVSRLSNGAVGGIAVYTRGLDGTEYYYAHLQSVAPGIQQGTAVEIGTVIGFVGDTGNARGGAPHVHFEVHQPGAVPPKTYVDTWLLDAEKKAPEFVASLVDNTIEKRRELRAGYAAASMLDAERGSPGSTPEYAMMLSLLDPISGLIGILPDVPLDSKGKVATPSNLIAAFVKSRVDGEILFAPTAQGPQGDGTPRA